MFVRLNRILRNNVASGRRFRPFTVSNVVASHENMMGNIDLLVETTNGEFKAVVTGSNIVNNDAPVTVKYKLPENLIVQYLNQDPSTYSLALSVHRAKDDWLIKELVSPLELPMKNECNTVNISAPKRNGDYYYAIIDKFNKTTNDEDKPITLLAKSCCFSINDGDKQYFLLKAYGELFQSPEENYRYFSTNT